MEYEMSMRQTVEADVARLRKLLDDTNVTRLHLESDIESLKEELITLKKNHLTVRGATQKSLARRKTAVGLIQLEDGITIQKKKQQQHTHRIDPLTQEITPCLFPPSTGCC